MFLMVTINSLIKDLKKNWQKYDLKWKQIRAGLSDWLSRKK